MAIGRTPVAIGSSVPVWPTRLAPRTALTRATTAAEVIPAGLSTTRTPCISDLEVGGQGGDDAAARLVVTGLDGAAGRAAVSATAERRADGAGVDASLGAHRDPHVGGRGLTR